MLNRLRDALRQRGYVPIVFNFDKPETKDFTETVRLLAGLSKFVIADITNPKSAPLELQATVPEIMVPFRPITEEGEKPFAMLQDLWSKHREWVFEPIHYSSVDALIASLDEKIIRPAEARFVELLKRKADGTYDGRVETVSNGTHKIKLTVRVPPNLQLIQGGMSGAGGDTSETEFSLPSTFLTEPFVSIETKNGPVNVKLVKIRGIND